MARSIQSRVLALVGIGVFAAGAGLAVLSRHSLLSLEASFRGEQERLATVMASALARDVLADEQILQGATNAPFVDVTDHDDRAERRALVPALRSARLASAICFLSTDGTIAVCEPARQQTRVLAPAVMAQVNASVWQSRPIVSDIVPLPDGDVLLLAIPLHSDTGPPPGAAVEIIDRADPRVLHAVGLRDDVNGLLLDGRGDTIAASAGGLRADEAYVAAPVEGAPWTLRLSALSSVAAVPVVTFRRTALLVAPLLAAIATLLAWGVASSVRHPVLALTDAAERIASGDLARPIPAGNGDEIGRLATALEEMRKRLQESIGSIEAWNAELEARVVSRTTELRRVMRQVISAQEDERRRVARELHDETSQLVAAIGMGLNGLARSSPDLSRTRMTELKSLVDRLHEGLHRLIVNLRPSILDDLGLAAAVQWLAEQQLARAGVSVRCELDDLADRRLPPELEITLFRVVQEAIGNIARHAHAESVLVQGAADEDAVSIEIEDDGQGFDPAKVVKSPGSLRGVGLLGMRERMELVGGTLDVDSAPGDGTRVYIRVPVTAGVMEVPS